MPSAVNPQGGVCKIALEYSRAIKNSKGFYAKKAEYRLRPF